MDIVGRPCIATRGQNNLWPGVVSHWNTNVSRTPELRGRACLYVLLNWLVPRKPLYRISRERLRIGAATTSLPNCVGLWSYERPKIEELQDPKSHRECYIICWLIKSICFECLLSNIIWLDAMNPDWKLETSPSSDTITIQEKPPPNKKYSPVRAWGKALHCVGSICFVFKPSALHIAFRLLISLASCKDFNEKWGIESAEPAWMVWWPIFHDKFLFDVPHANRQGQSIANLLG